MQIATNILFTHFFLSSKNDESTTSHGMVAVDCGAQPLPADDIRLPATVLAATARLLPASAKQIHPRRPGARSQPQVRREVERFEESRLGRHRRRHPNEPDLR